MNKQNFGIIGLVLGIVALACGILCPFAFPLIGLGELIFVAVAILGLVFSAIGRKEGNSGPATAGLVLSIIAIVLSIIFTLACSAGKKAVNTAVDAVTSEIETLNEEELQSFLDGLNAELVDGIEISIDTKGDTEATEMSENANVSESTSENSGINQNIGINNGLSYSASEGLSESISD